MCRMVKRTLREIDVVVKLLTNFGTFEFDLAQETKTKYISG